MHIKPSVELSLGTIRFKTSSMKNLSEHFSNSNEYMQKLKSLKQEKLEFKHSMTKFVQTK